MLLILYNIEWGLSGTDSRRIGENAEKEKSAFPKE